MVLPRFARTVLANQTNLKFFFYQIHSSFEFVVVFVFDPGFNKVIYSFINSFKLAFKSFYVIFCSGIFKTFGYHGRQLINRYLAFFTFLNHFSIIPGTVLSANWLCPIRVSDGVVASSISLFQRFFNHFSDPSA